MWILKSKSARHILLSSLTSFAIMCCIYPELLIFHTISFTRFSDTEFTYMGSFIATNQFLQGGVQLWNPYDQMPLAFYYLTGGILTMSNIMTSLSHTFLSHWSDQPGELLHNTYSVMYFFTSSLIRTAGSYILLKRFCSSRLVLFSATVLMSSLLSPQIYMGLNCGTLYSFFPLMAHFILRFFEKRSLNDFLLAFILFTTCVAFDGLVAMGYFYQGVHFFIVSCLIWYFIWGRKKASTTPSSHFNKPKTLASILATVLLFVLIMGPWAYLFKVNYPDYDFAKSGSRMENIFSVTEYFKRSSGYAPKSEFFFRMVDFSQNSWEYSWLFIGFVSVFFLLAGIIFPKDHRKYPFIFTVLFFILINSPREYFSFGAIAHWINALTNPFKFLPRSFHMTGAFLLPFVLCPLIAFGMQSIYEHYQSKKLSPQTLKRYWFFLGSFVIFSILALIQAETVARIYILFASSILTFVILVLSHQIDISGPRKNRTIVTLLLLLLTTDFYLMGRHYLRYVFTQVADQPYSMDTIPKMGELSLESQNPQIMPFRHYYDPVHVGSPPSYIQADAINNQGTFFRYTNLKKFFHEPRNHKPRHRAFTTLWSDPWVQKYLLEEPQMYFQVDQALCDKENYFQQIVEKGWGRKVAVVENCPTGTPDFASTSKLSHSSKIAPIKKNSKYLSWTLEKITPDQILKKDSLSIIKLPLPEDLPMHASTSVLTQDRDLLKVWVNGIRLTPAQGRLVRPMTFDVRNVFTHKLSIALLPEKLNQIKEIRFEYPDYNTEGVIAPQVFHWDSLQFSYQSAKDGWLVLHFAYDKKWQLKIDGKPQKIYKANRAFLGFPIKKGMQNIELSYWPDTSLRAGLGISTWITILTIFGTFIIALRRERSHESKIG